MHSTLTSFFVFVISGAKLSLFDETNKYFARKIAFLLTFFSKRLFYLHINGIRIDA